MATNEQTDTDTHKAIKRQSKEEEKIKKTPYSLLVLNMRSEQVTISYDLVQCLSNAHKPVTT